MSPCLPLTHPWPDIPSLTFQCRTEKPIAKVHAASEGDVDKAVQAARKALKDPLWKDISGSDRGMLMNKLADLMESKKEILATIDAWDNGKRHSCPFF